MKLVITLQVKINDLFIQHCAVSGAFSGKRKTIVETLLRKGASLHEKNCDFLTTLHISGDKGHHEIMELLLKHGAKVNALDGLGQTGTNCDYYYHLYNIINLVLSLAY